MIMRSIKTKNLQAIQTIRTGDGRLPPAALADIVAVSALILPCLNIART